MNGGVKTVTNQLEEALFYEYDTNGNVVPQTDAAGGIIYLRKFVAGSCNSTCFLYTYMLRVRKGLSFWRHHDILFIAVCYDICEKKNNSGSKKWFLEAYGVKSIIMRKQMKDNEKASRNMGSGSYFTNK